MSGYLYKFRDAHGELLYIGSTGQLPTRLAAHAKNQAWWPQVAHMDITAHATVEQARGAEKAAIRREAPRHNRTYAPAPLSRATSLQLLISDALGEDVHEHLTRQRTQGTPWHHIAADIYRRTGLRITSESLRSWHKAQQQAAA